MDGSPAYSAQEDARGLNHDRRGLQEDSRGRGQENRRTRYPDAVFATHLPFAIVAAAVIPALDPAGRLPIASPVVMIVVVVITIVPMAMSFMVIAVGKCGQRKGNGKSRQKQLQGTTLHSKYLRFISAEWLHLWLRASCPAQNIVTSSAEIRPRRRPDSSTLCASARRP